MSSALHPLSVVTTSDLGTVALGASPVASTVLGLVTAGIVFVVVVIAGFVLLARRSRRARGMSRVDDTATRADIALVRLDDDILEADREIGFAAAQFGDAAAEPLRDSVAAARSSLTRAFALNAQLDEPAAASPSVRRERAAQIMMICEAASERLAAELVALDDMRARERTAADDLRRIERSIGETRSALVGAETTLADLSRRFAGTAVAPVSENPARAGRLLATAERDAGTARAGLDSAGAGSVSGFVVEADRAVRAAADLLRDVSRHSDRMTAASQHLDGRIAEAGAAVDAARRARDDAPSPDTAAAIAESVDWVARIVAELRSASSPVDPDAAAARLDGALDALDTAVSTARTEEDRLSHARDALAGALVTARSQLETTRAYIASRPGGVGAAARTRLAEAERLLVIAEAEADPVIALDTARSSATMSRDADALARYDLTH